MEDKFWVIGFTQPGYCADIRKEANAIVQYLESKAIDFFHIRKKEVSDEDLAALLNLIPSKYFSRLVLHSNENLSSVFDFGGIHLKNPSAHRHKKSFITSGCHSLDEVKETSDNYRYSFLSPIFDSISKPGYNSRFNISDTKLQNLLAKRTIIALGGVKPNDFEKLFKAKFAGAALLGYLWSPKKSTDEIIRELLDRRSKLKTI